MSTMTINHTLEEAYMRKLVSEFKALDNQIDRLKEDNSLLKWENKNLKSFLKFKGYTEEQITRVSLLRGKK